jgi:hypothetical protein
MASSRDPWQLTLTAEQLHLLVQLSDVRGLAGLEELPAAWQADGPDRRLAVSSAARALGARGVLTISADETVQVAPATRNALASFEDPAVLVVVTRETQSSADRTVIVPVQDGGGTALTATATYDYVLRREPATSLEALVRALADPHRRWHTGMCHARSDELTDAGVVVVGVEVVARLHGSVIGETASWATDAEGRYVPLDPADVASPEAVTLELLGRIDALSSDDPGAQNAYSMASVPKSST